MTDGKLDYRLINMCENGSDMMMHQMETFSTSSNGNIFHVIKWKHFPRNLPFVQGIHWSWPVNSPHKASDVEL